MSHGQTARLFLALDLPSGVREQLASWARAAASALAGARGRGAAGARLLDPELMHLTLCFLGARPAEEIQALAAAVTAAAAPALELSLGAPLWLPPRHPRALAVAIGDPDGALAGVRESMAEALAAAVPWEREHRRFRPHVTVARLSAGSAQVVPERPLPPTPAISFPGDSVSLYRSWLSPAGASYERLATVQLAGDGA